MEARRPSFQINRLAVFVDNVTKSYTSGVPILHNLNMRVDTGIVYGLLGSSGCGKTTLLSCILGLKEWGTGQIAVHGFNVSKGSPVQSSRVGYMPQECALHEYLTPEEIFKCYGNLYGMTKDKIEAKWKELSKLLDMRKLRFQRISSLSGGQKRRVSLAVTLVHNPDLLILDEPTVGLDPLLRMRIWDYFHHMTKANGVTILVTTHYVEELRRAQMIGVMRNCKLILEQDPKSLMSLYDTPLLEEAVLAACRKNEIYSKAIVVQNNSHEKDTEGMFMNNTVNELDLLQSSALSLTKISYVSNFDCVSVNNPTSIRESGNGPSSGSIFQRIYKLLSYSCCLQLGLLRDVRVVAFILLLPFFQMVTTIPVIGTDPISLPFGVINNENLNWTRDQDCGWSSKHNGSSYRASCLFIEELSKSKMINPIPFLNRESAESQVALGEIWGYVDIPEWLSQRLEERAAYGLFADEKTIDGTVIRVKMDSSNIIIHYSIVSTIYNAVIAYLNNYSKLKGFDQALDIPVKESFPGVYGNPNMTVGSYTAAVATIMVPLEITIAIAFFMILNDKSQHILQRVRLTGLGTIQYMLAVTFAILPHAGLSTLIVYWTVIYVFNYEIYCSLFTFLFQGVLSGLVGIGCGLFLAIIAGNLMTCIIIEILIISTSAFYMGLVRPVENIPKILRYISNGFPVVPLAETIKSTMNRGVALTHSTAWPGILMTVGWLVVVFAISVMFRKRLNF